MSIVLENGVRASESSAHELEQHIASQQAGIRRDVEALMLSVIDVFNDINVYIDGIREEIEQGDGEKLPAASEAEYHHLYVRLERVFQKVAGFGRQIENWGLSVKGKDKFKNEWRRIKGVVAFNPSKVEESFAQIDRGQVKSLGDFADELARRAI